MSGMVFRRIYRKRDMKYFKSAFVNGDKFEQMAAQIIGQKLDPDWFQNLSVVLQENGIENTFNKSESTTSQYIRIKNFGITIRLADHPSYWGGNQLHKKNCWELKKKSKPELLSTIASVLALLIGKQ